MGKGQAYFQSSLTTYFTVLWSRYCLVGHILFTVLINLSISYLFTFASNNYKPDLVSQAALNRTELMFDGVKYLEAQEQPITLQNTGTDLFEFE